MKSILERFEDINLLNVDILNSEVNFLKISLEVLRVTSQISNDAFLDAGIIQGGLSLISIITTKDKIKCPYGNISRVR